MKRCPQCNRVESDNTLSFCRVDGTTLIKDPGPVSEGDAGTVRFDSSAIAQEIHTSILPRAVTDINIPRDTEPVGSQAPVAATPNEPVRRSRKWPRVLVALASILAITACALFLYASRRKSLPPIESIAVMPFINASGNADAEYLSDGITETLINSLSQLPNLSVKARSSVFRYKGTEFDPRTVGGELTVQAILNGRVVQRGDDLTIYLSLVDTRTGNQIWGDQYNRKQADLVSLQSEIGRDVVSKLRTKLSGTDEQKVAKNSTQNAEAYQLYLQGRFFLNKRTTENMKKAIGHFQQAIEKDPTYGLGYAGLSDGYALLAYYGGAPASEAFPKARAAAVKAVALDDNLAESHNALGFVFGLSDYDYVGAEREYRRALELNPNYALSHQNLGVMLYRIGRTSEGTAELQQALALEPFSPIVNRLYGDLLTFGRRNEEALVQLKKTLELEPSFPTTHLSLSSLYQITGRYAESVESYANYLQLSGRVQDAVFVRESFARGGWQQYMRDMTGPRRPQGLSHYLAASYYVQLGEKDNAFAELDKSLNNREWPLLYVRIDPRFESLRDNPRYTELLRRMRFPVM